MKIKNDFIGKIKCLFRRVKKLELSQGAGTAVSWSAVVDKPTTFAPAAHTHTIAQVTGLQGGLNSKLTATQGAAVTDAVDETDVVAQFNSLLASLRASGVIAT